MSYKLLFLAFLLKTFNCLAFKLVNDEFFVQKCGNQLILEGRYLVEQKNFGKEFWICVDYESSVERNVTNFNKYPAQECGGKPYSTKNLFWYAFHGLWDNEKNDVLKIYYSSSSIFALPEYERVIPPFESDHNALGWHWILREESERFRLVQSHGSIYGGKVKRNDLDSVTLRIGETHIRSVAEHSNIHIRINGVGLQIEQVYEQKYDEKEKIRANKLMSVNTNHAIEICSN